MPFNHIGVELGESNRNGSLESVDSVKDSLHEQGEDESVDEYKRELVRLMIQQLQVLGYGNSASVLEKESGIFFESESISRFKSCILEGEWDVATGILEKYQFANEENMDAVKFMILKQKFLEYLENGLVQEGLRCLRQEITPLKQDPVELHRLSSYMMAGNSEMLRKKARWGGVAGNSRMELLVDIRRYISSNRMLPERRLESLLEQARKSQIANCLYHNVSDDGSGNGFTLLEDHKCDKSNIPNVPAYVLGAHSDEVWCIKFSNNGKMLASSSKDGTVKIWNMESMKCMKTLQGDSGEVSFVAWSPDDALLLSCGGDGSLKIWDVSTGRCVKTISNHKPNSGSCNCAWFPDGDAIVSGGLDKRVFVYDRSGNVTKQFVSGPVTSIVVSNDGKNIITIGQERNISIFDLETEAKIKEIKECEPITSLTLSSDGKKILVNVKDQAIHVWDLETFQLVRAYHGQKQGRFVIRSCFGGVNESFIASGSEDCKVYIWNEKDSTPIDCLIGHTQTVNCVSWSPADPHMLASASDDHTIRIWRSQYAVGNKKVEDHVCGLSNGHDRRNTISSVD
eukprot:Nk52_evm17s162 gene=Nk52_evmTU17s162